MMFYGGLMTKDVDLVHMGYDSMNREWNFNDAGQAYLLQFNMLLTYDYQTPVNPPNSPFSNPK